MAPDTSLTALDSLDPALADWIRRLREDPESAVDLGPEGMRNRPDRGLPINAPELWEVRDVETPEGIRARLYRNGDAPAPGILYVHGGGWVCGDLDSHDAICRRLARDTGSTVLAVDYSRTPEAAYPLSLTDSEAAYHWFLEHRAELGALPEVPIAVAGDSAGGHLALLIAQRAAGTEHAVSAQLLWYPVTDLSHEAPSYAENERGWGLTRDSMRWFIDQTIPVPEDRRDPIASPLYGNLHNLGPTVVVTAGHDVLRDEGLALAAGIAAAGGSIVLRHEPHLIHGFLGLNALSPLARVAEERALAEFAQWR